MAGLRRVLGAAVGAAAGNRLRARFAAVRLPHVPDILAQFTDGSFGLFDVCPSRTPSSPPQSTRQSPPIEKAQAAPSCRIHTL